MNPVFCLMLIQLSLPAKTPFQLRHLYDVVTPSHLAVHPAQPHLIAVTETTTTLTSGQTHKRIVLLNQQQGAQKALTRETWNSDHAFWSPDGQQLYFLSDREKGTQLWVLPMTGGDPQRLTDMASGVEMPRLLPNGKGIVFASTVFPECLEQSECQQEQADAMETGPIQAYLADELLYRHWMSYRKFQYRHLFLLDLPSGQVRALTKGKNDFPAYGGTYDISPDSRQLAVVVKLVDHPEISTNTDIALLDIAVKDAPLINITQDNPGADALPLFDPQGHFLAFVRQKRAMAESDLKELRLYHRVTKAMLAPVEPLDNWVEQVSWHPNGTSLLVTVHEQGAFPLYRFDISTRTFQPFRTGRSIHELVQTTQGVITIESRAHEPREVFFHEHAALDGSAITSWNRSLVAEVDLRPAEPFWIEGAEGKPLHGFLIKPHGFDETKHYPCILNVHGGPQFQWTDTFRGDWQMYPGSGYVVAFVNPHGSTGYGQAYCDAIRMDYDGKVMTDILRVADYLGSLNFIDDQRMGAMGWSWGGYAMMYLAGIDHPFQSLAAMMGVFDLASMYGSTEELWFVHHDNGGAPWENPDYYRRASPSSRSHQLKTPCLVITGELDYRVPYSQSLQFFTALQRNGVHSRLIVFPNDGHWPHPVKSMPLYYNAHLEWFHATLGGDPAPYVTEELVRQGRIPPTKAAQAPSSHP